MTKEKVVIIGAGPAGLTASYELLKNNDKYDVVILEETGSIGGIAKTVNYRGNRMDMGGHRFFSKDARVNEWWDEMEKIQGVPSYDDRILKRECNIQLGGPDPDKEDEVMLLRHRVSRILFDGKFYDYPISLKPETFINMGFVNTVKCGFSYLHSMIRKLPEDNLENFYINRFGKKLYSMFFEYYTENLWGRHPKEIDASWGAQRVKGLSISAVLKDIVRRMKKDINAEVETSLIEEFKYPKFGPGQLWEITAKRIVNAGGCIQLNSKVVGIENANGKVSSVAYVRDGKKETMECDFLISSMPIKDLICGFTSVPQEVLRIAKGLPYRDYMTLGVLVNHINLENKTKIKTIGNIVPDCWIYVQDRNVKLGRMQIYNNWSPYMVDDIDNTIWIGLEYFVNEGDSMWSMEDDKFADFGISEMVKLGLIDDKNQVLDTHIERVKKAYPAYFDTYAEIDTVIDYLGGIDNLFCVGRNGQHRYNNMDHSMVTSFEAVKCIKEHNIDKSAIWNVNTEKEYHEVKRD